ncbi:hypothetical protein [Ornithinimicrobium panacihumi]|uniref:hypothetical protein n=1 Tax=Ornithinimicrobium panacihumi TaxID=2008449 RepID=UPI003F8A612A
MGWHSDQFQPVASPVWPDDDESLLAVLLDLHESNRVPERVQNVSFSDPMPER